MNGVLTGNVYPLHLNLHLGGTHRRPRACSFRVILSISNNQTATAALRRNGSARLALEAGGSSHRAVRKETQSDTNGTWCAFAPISACKPVLTPAFKASCVSIFGGSQVGATYASKQGLVSIIARMPSAPLTLDPGANQEGDA